ncbi:amidohydrolase family protein [Ponticoccus sp. SC2-23]|uniref:amidohydrolase family protein n=1 Tax=Alexandriicola marinus TaxID=2081710 RepID=UPI000FDAD063|nr:amidohydrolase family protein [Alexandriicola marinus]MBM1220876.1 amidohydrolase family protein [Ponticoccus sp. SC6-9]MBM1225446.1 amidohydrolase family protein [Ponticoccus sp. SC6-15]MBM1227629.1 amidohydrolase family protein [Ponticoccus sp. SC6-38]MBM1234733.1 amidohydrolase family protein [Ponticoccus sp. SC6-45]MBM1238131.1 amidohydrolase family protein [Ponticoccus sp. SC6-49]MBM1244236.1 amidohydrolase family protein [Ponticoccus sp. SC2-64]MBM1248257.1 amidohydrolase family pro
MKIDAHHHLWQPARGDYDWMPMDNEILARPYFPPDYLAVAEAAGIERSVIVQAAATTAETEYMLGLADATDMIAAVVGWIDFEDPSQIETLARFAGHPKFRGVRPMIQDIPDVDWMLREDVQWAFEAVSELGLTFDALGFPRHLENFHTILTRYPEMQTVIDHCMKPQITDPGGFDHWAAGMTRLATDTEACVKFSGLVTEAAEDWTIDQLRPYAELLFEAFGPDRIMWGSDWPVVRLRAEYDRWYAAAEELTRPLGAEAQARIFGGTAREFYEIGVSVSL